jgi:ABC-type sugar transport system permease subunit
LLQRLAPLAWLGPSIILIVGVVVYPVVELVILSFQKFNAAADDQGFWGLNNFRDLFAEPALVHVLTNTVLWVAVVVSLTVALSLCLAQFLDKPFVGRKLVRLALIVPWAASLVMTSIVWNYIFNYYYGTLNRVLLDLHIIGAPIAWTQDPSTELWSLIAVAIIVSIPFTTFVFLAGLQSIPGEVYEAATLDGASRRQAYRHVTLPLLRPAVTVATILNIIYVFNSFPIIWVMTGNQPGSQADTTITFMYKIAFHTNLDIGEASALGLLNVVFMVLVVGIYLRSVRFSRRAADV